MNHMIWVFAIILLSSFVESGQETIDGITQYRHDIDNGVQHQTDHGDITRNLLSSSSEITISEQEEISVSEEEEEEESVSDDDDNSDDSSSDDITPSPTTREPTTVEPTPAPTNILLDDVLLTCVGIVIVGNFAVEGQQQLDFRLSTDVFQNSFVTITVTGANFTLRDESGTIIVYINDGEGGSATVSAAQIYTATVWQTDIDIDDWLVAMGCTSAAPTSEPTPGPTQIIVLQDQAGSNDKSLSLQRMGISKNGINDKVMVELSPYFLLNLWIFALLCSLSYICIFVWFWLKKSDKVRFPIATSLGSDLQIVELGI